MMKNHVASRVRLILACVAKDSHRQYLLSATLLEAFIRFQCMVCSLQRSPPLYMKTNNHDCQIAIKFFCTPYKYRRSIQRGRLLIE